jgi:ubiquinone/menaquinone biosynthesis C-methylase UbiE
LIISQSIQRTLPLAEAEQTRLHYDKIADYYDTALLPLEWLRFGALRAWVCGNLSGKILEAGIGSGLNLPYYKADCEVTGVDLSEAMLSLAAQKAAYSACGVRLLKMDATRLDFPDQSFDACLSTFLFTGLSEDAQLAALREMLRVTRKGGIVRLVDCQYSRTWVKRMVLTAGAPLAEAFLRCRFDSPIKQAMALSGATVLWEGSMRGDTLKVYDLVAPGKSKGGRKK